MILTSKAKRLSLLVEFRDRLQSRSNITEIIGAIQFFKIKLKHNH